MADKTWRFCNHCGEPLVHTVSSKPKRYDVITGKPEYYRVTVQCTATVGKRDEGYHLVDYYSIRPEEREFIGLETIPWETQQKEKIRGNTPTS